MEGVTPFAEAQISATHVIANILHEVSRHRKGQFNTPIYSSETTGHGVPLDPVRTLIIADTSQLTVRATNRLENRNGLALLLGFLNLFGVGLLLLHLPGQCALDGLGGLDTGGTHQLSRKVRRLCSQRIVRAFVQLHTIATGRGKASWATALKQAVCCSRVALSVRACSGVGFNCTVIVLSMRKVYQI